MSMHSPHMQTLLRLLIPSEQFVHVQASAGGNWHKAHLLSVSAVSIPCRKLGLVSLLPHGLGFVASPTLHPLDF